MWRFLVMVVSPCAGKMAQQLRPFILHCSYKGSGLSSHKGMTAHDCLTLVTKIYFYFVCVCLHVHMCTTCMLIPWKAEEPGSLELEWHKVLSNSMGAGNYACVLWKAANVLRAYPSLQRSVWFAKTVLPQSLRTLSFWSSYTLYDVCLSPNSTTFDISF